MNQAWLDEQLAANASPHVFVFGHEPAFKTFHSDCLGSFPADRNTFWSSLASSGARVTFAGHDHFFDALRVDDGDGNADDDLLQLIVGSGGGTLFTNSAYNGDNSPYTPVALHHDVSFGYLLVEVSGDRENDLDVTMTWKRRHVDPGTSAVTYVTAKVLRTSAASRSNIRCSSRFLRCHANDSSSSSACSQHYSSLPFSSTSRRTASASSSLPPALSCSATSRQARTRTPHPTLSSPSSLQARGIEFSAFATAKSSRPSGFAWPAKPPAGSSSVPLPS